MKADREILTAALNYIKHVGSNWTMRGEPHPQQWIVDGMESLLARPEEKRINLMGQFGRLFVPKLSVFAITIHVDDALPPHTAEFRDFQGNTLARIVNLDGASEPQSELAAEIESAQPEVGMPKRPLPWSARGDTVLHRLPSNYGDNVLIVARCHSEQDAAFIAAIANRFAAEKRRLPYLEEM